MPRSLVHPIFPLAAAFLFLAGMGSDVAGSLLPSSLELEGGVVWQTRNDIEIPNDGSATRFSVVDLVGRAPDAAWRAYVSWELGRRHSLRALYAPLTLTESGVPAGDLSYNGDLFLGGQDVATIYRFNSYRLTYRYRWHEGERWTWHVGFTAKIRDARVQLRQGDLVSTKDDVGFVPLLHVAGRYRFDDAWYASLDLDALAGGPGRAEDVALKLGWNLRPDLAWEIGYRTVEGGADVDEVYSFAWLHYVVAGVRVEF